MKPKYWKPTEDDCNRQIVFQEGFIAGIEFCKSASEFAKETGQDSCGLIWLIQQIHDVAFNLHSDKDHIHFDFVNMVQNMVKDIIRENEENIMHEWQEECAEYCRTHDSEYLSQTLDECNEPF